VAVFAKISSAAAAHNPFKARRRLWRRPTETEAATIRSAPRRGNFVSSCVYQSIASAESEREREIARSQPEGSRQGNVYRVPGDNRSQRAHSNRTNHGSACRAGAASALAGPSSSSIYARTALSPAASSSNSSSQPPKKKRRSHRQHRPLSDGRTDGRSRDGVQQRESGRPQPAARRAAAPPPPPTPPQPPGPPLGRETPAGRSYVLPRPRLQLLAGT
jgi:hypothetical protein